MAISSVSATGHWGQLPSTTDITNNTSSVSVSIHEEFSYTTEAFDDISDNTDDFEEIISVGILFYTVLMSTFLAFAVCSNCLVIYCVVRFTALRTVTNIFICNLSISDILLAGFVMPQRLHDIFHKGSYHEGN